MLRRRYTRTTGRKLVSANSITADSQKVSDGNDAGRWLLSYGFLVCLTQMVDVSLMSLWCMCVQVVPTTKLPLWLCPFQTTHSQLTFVPDFDVN